MGRGGAAADRHGLRARRVARLAPGRRGALRAQGAPARRALPGARLLPPAAGRGAGRARPRHPVRRGRAAAGAVNLPAARPPGPLRRRRRGRAGLRGPARATGDRAARGLRPAARGHQRQPPGRARIPRPWTRSPRACAPAARPWSTAARCPARRRPWSTCVGWRGAGRRCSCAPGRSRRPSPGRWRGRGVPSPQTTTTPGGPPRELHRRRQLPLPGHRRGRPRRGGDPPRGGRAAGGDAGDDRQRELHQPRGAPGGRVGAHEQVRRGAARAALLRRLRGRGPGGAARHRPRQGGLRRGPRQRAAALGGDGQRGRLRVGPPARRPRPRHGARPRRAPVARAQGQLLRPALRLPATTGCAAGTAASTWTRCATWRASCGPR